jgi:hypothetical protein
VEVVVLGFLDPVAPLRSETPTSFARVALELSRTIVVTPPDLEGCWELFPCAPSDPTGLELRIRDRRTIVTRTEDRSDAVRAELGIP